MKPQPYDEGLLRWLVESGSREGETHLVDLGEGEDGECSCEDHTCRKRRCKHITAVREALTDLIIEHEKKQRREPRNSL